MVAKKSKSKRVTLKQKFKVERKVKDHKKKIKKFARENPTLRRAKKDPGIPNLWPFKQALLAQAEGIKNRELEEKEASRQKKKALDAKKKAAAIQQEKDDIAFGKELATPEGKRKWYFKELKKVVEAADIIIEVLDARDPLGCRALDIEQMVSKQMNPDGTPSKKIVIVLNKIDLVPADVVEKWVQYIRREYPCLAFKSSTQQQTHNMGSITAKPSKVGEKSLSSSSAVGAGPLLQLLKNYCRSLNVKKQVNVGVIGYPNVGKSSIINSLKRSRAVQVSSAPGCTKSLQHVRLDNNINLIDSPGVLFSADDDDNKNLLLRNVLRVEQVEDPASACKGILERCTKEQLMEIYQIADFSSTEEFLGFVAHRRGKLGKGGVPNYVDAARAILQDWNSGKIPFHTTPPKVHDVQETTIVNGWGKDFDIDAVLDKANSATLRELSGIQTNGGNNMEDDEDLELVDGDEDEQGDSEDMLEEFEDEDDEEEEEDEMEEEEEEEKTSSVKAVKKIGGKFDLMMRDDDVEEISSYEKGGLEKRRKDASSVKPVISVKSAKSLIQGEGNQQRNRSIKEDQKKKQKQMRRLAAGATQGADNYNFDTDWQ